MMLAKLFAIFMALVILSVTVTGCREEPVLDEAAVSLIDARQAIDDGDSAKAMELLNASIEAKPDTWAYYERAKLHADSGDDALAKDDVKAGLELDPEHSDLLWLEKQLKKGKSARFKSPPPSVNK